MYVEGYLDEGLIEESDDSGDPTVTHSEVHRSGGTTITDRKHSATFSGAKGEMAAFGFQERTLG